MKKAWANFLIIAAILGFAADYYWLENTHQLGDYAWIIGFAATWTLSFYFLWGLGYASFFLAMLISVPIIGNKKIDEPGCVLIPLAIVLFLSITILVFNLLNSAFSGYVFLYLFEYPKIGFEWIKFYASELLSTIAETSKIQ